MRSVHRGKRPRRLCEKRSVRALALALAVATFAFSVRALPPEVLRRSTRRAFQGLSIRAHWIALATLAESLANKLWRLLALRVLPAAKRSTMTSWCFPHKSPPLLTIALILLIIKLRLIIIRPPRHIWLIFLALKENGIGFSVVIGGVAIVAVVQIGLVWSRSSSSTEDSGLPDPTRASRHRRPEPVRHIRVLGRVENRRALSRVHDVVGSVLREVTDTLDVCDEMAVLHLIHRHLS